MYQPAKYKQEDPEYIFQFIQENPFAGFVLQGEKLLATHIPVLMEGDAENFRIYSHIANHNPQRKFLEDEKEALLIFQAPEQGYISSSWYREKDISTWDYAAVHLNIKLKLQTKEELSTSLEKLVNHFESGEKAPLWFKDIPKKMFESHLPLITGFWGEVIEAKAIAKFHQGHDADNIKRIRTQLKERDLPGDGILKNKIKEINDSTN